MAETNGDWDAIVIGGGPAGSTVATLLAEAGHRVFLAERGRFPRYHIGESLLPGCYGTLDRLGLLPALASSRFVKKYSVQFVSPEGQVAGPFYFTQHLDDESAQTWQVVRAEFDRMLLDNARAKGVHVVTGTRVTGLDVEDGRVVGVSMKNGDEQVRSQRAKVVIDASGRTAVAVRQFGWHEPNQDLDRIALWTYIRGAKRDPGLDEGATTIAYLPDKGWFWYIPQPDDLTSVGVVARRDYLYREHRDLEKIFAREVAFNPWIAEYLAPGEAVEPFRATGNYSYSSKRYGCDGLVLVGDAFSFIDPVFSTGIYLALRGGALCADAIDKALREGDVSLPAFADYGEKVSTMVETLRRLVYAFYDPNFSFGELLRRFPDVRPDLTDCLVGNVERDFAALWSALGELTGPRHWLPDGVA